MITNIITLIVVGGVIVLMVGSLVFIFVMMLLAGKQESVLSREGMTTDAEVVDWEFQKIPQISPNVSPVAGFITYRFYADTPAQARQLFTKKENVWVSVHLKHPQGSRIRIYYLPSDPNICQIAETISGVPHDQP